MLWIALQLLFGALLFAGGIYALVRVQRWRRTKETEGADLNLSRRPVLLIGFAVVFGGVAVAVFAFSGDSLPYLPLRPLYLSPLLIVVGVLLLEISTRFER